MATTNILILLWEEALEWMVTQDPMQLLLDNSTTISRFIQRFSLVAFYLQTSSQQPWKFCGPDNKTDTCFFEYEQANEMISGGEVPAARWLSGATECAWMGVMCSDNVISTLEICKCHRHSLPIMESMH